MPGPGSSNPMLEWEGGDTRNATPDSEKRDTTSAVNRRDKAGSDTQGNVSKHIAKRHTQ